MNDYFADLERELCAAASARAHLPWHRRRRSSRAGGDARASRRGRRLTRLQVVAIAILLVLASATVGLAASGVILTGAPVPLLERPAPTVGQGIPVPRGVTLLGLRAPDPAGGPPWGMRVETTTRGLVCVQVGRIVGGQLGELGVDGAFNDDGRFHALPTDALPDVMPIRALVSNTICQSPGDIFAGDIVGIERSAASNPEAGTGVSADRREISFGLLGERAVTITYRLGAGAATRRVPVLPGLGAYLIVQRVTSGRRVGSISATDGSDLRYGFPASPNGALTAIAYRTGRGTCVDTGRGPLTGACQWSGAPPHPPALGRVDVPVAVHLHVRGHLVTGGEISFRAPFAVTDAGQDYIGFVRNCPGPLSGSGISNRDIRSGETVTLSLLPLLATYCGKPERLEVEYTRMVGDIPASTKVATVTIALPAGAHVAPALRLRGPSRGR